MTPCRVTPRRSTAAAVLTLALVTAGCASVVGSGHPGTETSTTTAVAIVPDGQIVFQMWQGSGGPLPPGRALGLRPEVTVYGDGTAFVAPRTDENRNYPGTPIAFVRGRVSAVDLRSLVERAERSELFDGLDYGDTILPDAGGVAIEFRPGDTPARTVEVYGLQNTSAEAGLHRDQRRHRAALRTFADRLYRSVELPTGSEARWTPGRIDVTAAPVEGPRDAPTSWPGPPVASFVHDSAHRGRCGVLAGSSARRVWNAARSHGSTTWTVGHFVIRALLPGEAGCR